MYFVLFYYRIVYMLNICIIYVTVQPSNRSIYTKKEKTIHDTDAELDEIDHRLNVLQGFFEKYLVNS